MKNKKLLVTLALLFSATIFAQSPSNGGFENGSINSVTDWAGHVGGGTSTVTTTNARTGTYSLAHATSSNTAPPSGQDNITATFLSLPSGWYIHAIGWARGTDANAKAQMRCTVNASNTSGTQTVNGALNNATQRVTVSAQNPTGSAQDSYCRTSSRTLTNTVLTTVYWDDIIMYTSPLAAVDLIKPLTALSFTTGATLPGSISFSWTNGSDAATGIQSTIILRTSVPTPTLPPVMNDQGIYSLIGNPTTTGPNKVSTDWDVISTSVLPGTTTYTDLTAIPGTTYRYAVIHRDLAYNYSAALYSVTPITCPSIITSTTTGGLWSVGTTWVNGVAPASNSDVIIATGATVTMDSAITRNTGTNTTVNSGATLATGAFAYNNNGATTVNGTFKLDNSGSVTGNDLVYGGSPSTLVIGTPITISGANTAWPVTNYPYNVSVTGGGLTINAGISRTVPGTFLAAAAVTLIPTSVLTISDICQINSGGNFANSAPTYGNVSTLIYNVGGSFSVSNEWTGSGATPTAGLGTPQNVTIQNSTTLTMPAANRSMAGDLTISSGNLTLNGGDLNLAGNWTRVSTASFTHGNRTVYFTSSITQTVTVSALGTETFYVLNIQGSGTLKLATGTNILITAASGLALNSSNATSTVDLNGQTLTVSGGGILGWSSGARKITSTLANGSFVISTSGLTISIGGAGTLTTDINTIVKLSQSFNPGVSITTINGTLQINLNGSITGNSPIYGSNSLLQYNSTLSYNRTLEWTSDVATIGTTPGYPNNVQISNNTTFNYYNATYTGPKGMNGNFTIDAGSAISFGGVTTGGALTAMGNVSNAGTMTLGVALGDDIKLEGNFTNTGTFNGNNRAIWFSKTTGSGFQTVSSTTVPFIVPYIKTSGGTTVQLQNNVTVPAPLLGAAITFVNADIIDLNGNTLIIGTAGLVNTITGPGTFKGSNIAIPIPTSNITLLGTGSIGTLNFTSGFQNLGTFTMNRQAATIGCVLGSALSVNASLVLTNGLIDLGTNNLTLGATATAGGASSNSYVLAYGTLGGQLIKTFSAAGAFTYPIGDNTLGLDYSPATLTLGAGTYAGTVGVRVVDDTLGHPSKTGADFLTRYWQVLISGTITPSSYTFAGTYISGAGDVTGTEANCLPQCWNGTSWTDINATPIGSSICTVNGSSFPYPTNEFSAQTASLYYRSKVSGDWTVAGTWETSLDNATWSNAAAAPTTSANTITILTGHTVTITSNVTMDQVYVTGNLTISGSPVTATLNNGTGTDLTINNGGVVTMAVGTSGGWSVTGTTTSILSGGTYIHNSARAVTAFLNTATMDTNSTEIYRGSSTLTPAVSLGNHTFGHLRFESTGGSYTLTPNFSVTICTSNDFWIGSGVTISASSLISTSQFVVSGNFTNNGTMNNAVGFFNFTFSGTSKTISGAVVPNFDTINVTGSYTMSVNVALLYTTGVGTVAIGGILDNGGEYQITGSASATFTVNGKFITRDAQGFTGTNSAIPTLIVAVGTSSTVEYGGPSQTITAFTTYNNVTVSGTGTKTLLTTPIIMNGDLTVNASILLVNAAEVIEVKKAVTVAASGATFEIKNNGQLVQVDDTANAANVYTGGNTGNIIYNRTATAIKGYDYVYWASPVTGQTIDAIYSSPSPGFKYLWSPQANNVNTAGTGCTGIWQTATGAMTPAKGYIVRGSSFYGMAATNIPAVFTGVPGNGIISTTISRGGNTIASQPGVTSTAVSNFDDNWNLVGNPYPSAIDANEFLKVTNNPNIQGFINVWTHGTAPVSTTSPFYNSFGANYTSNDYITYNRGGSQSGPSVFNGFIGAGQGFFVSMNDGAFGSSTVTFNNSMRLRTHNNTVFYKSTTDQEVDEKNRIWLDLVDSNNEAVRTLVGYFPEAVVGLDRTYDAFKNVANDKNIYSLAENTTLIIQGRPTPFDVNDQVPIGVRIMSEGNYKIAIAAVDGLFEHDQPIFLEDRELNVIYDLRQNPYSFSSVTGTFNDRFVLRYTNSALGNPDFGDIENSVVLASNHGELTIKSFVENIEEVTVYDVLGRQLFFAKEISSNTFVTSNISASQQTLIVKIKLENGVMVSRKIIL